MLIVLYNGCKMVLVALVVEYFDRVWTWYGTETL